MGRDLPTNHHIPCDIFNIEKIPYLLLAFHLEIFATLILKNGLLNVNYPPLKGMWEGFLLDSDPAVIWPKLLKQIKCEKDQRRHEILVLERKKKILDIREDQISHDLEQLEGIR
jgi:hypothetical protein